ncbi:hypothetical protein NA57DRAFT_74928 [Rhizodiscina lignyota]|uniref:Protein CFT1 n=1 Tax=Rhizodiscina lignyota TaxID=1504668 RepID=A0A9P4IHK1_9PEZI|nr:hypothetical protein NA57DRAFT_74928 [Rhizodiscina lignyota]
MQSYTELTPPTAVNHAINLPLLGPKANNLVVAKTSLLQIFELKTITTEVEGTPNEDTGLSLQRTNTNGDGGFLDGEYSLQRLESTTKLVLTSEYALSGTIIGLQAVKILNSKSGGDALLVAFKDAKLSLVEWDPQSHSISTISIHFYEGEELVNNPWAPDIGRCHSYLAVDPSSRCAALKFGVRHLAILPFRQAGDDLVEDYDPELDGPREESPAKAANGEESSHETPYGTSFVLPLTAMDPALTHPIHIAFLYEYREPTFGILSASRAPSNALIYERRDTLTYNVFTLDIEQKASTTILSVSGLPYDLHQVVALPLPVGGSLLVGSNVLVHVDQAGKTTGVAVNEFAKSSSAFAMTDQSDLRLRLEGSTIQQLGESTDMLVVLDNGEFALLTFKMDGRSISGVSVHKIGAGKGGTVVKAMASCAANLGRNRMFIGSEDGDSVVLGWTRKAPQLSRKRSHAEMLAGDVDLDLDEDDIMDDGDDDLYDTGATLSRTTSATSSAAAGPDALTFRVHDCLPNLGPMKDITIGRTLQIKKGSSSTTSGHEIVASTGRGRAGGIAVINMGINPVVLQQSSLQFAQAVWSVHTKKQPPRGFAAGGNDDSEATLSADAEYGKYLIASRTKDDGSEDSVIYQITPTGIAQCDNGDFESDAGATVEVGTIAGGTRIVQVLRSEIKCFGSELELAQILPMEDEATGAELKVLAASFCDPYVLLIRDDSSVVVLEADKNGDIDEVPRGTWISKQWLSGCIYKSPETNDTPLVCLLSAQGGLAIFDISNFDEPVWQTEGLNLLPSMITKDFVSRRAAARETLTELVVADIGDHVSKTPYLVVRTGSDDLAIYQPFHHPPRSQGDSFTTNLQWRKVLQPRLAPYYEDASGHSEHHSALRVLHNISGYSAIFQAGPSPSFILKEASNSPKVVPLAGGRVKGLSSFHTAQCDRGFAYVDAEGDFRVCRLPDAYRLGDSGWPTRKIDFGEQVDGLAYHDAQECYAIGTCMKANYKLPEDDYHHEWGREDTTFLPQTDQGMLKLLHPGNWSVIDAFPLEPSEVVMTIKTLTLEVSEETHKRKPLIAVGTAVICGEDLPTKGALYIFDVVSVVPEPERPETNRKLKLIVREEVKGAVTALCEIGTQGFMLAAQGQKAMVRGLKEDDTILPTAFIDTQCYVSVAKSLKGTGMAIMGDLVKGLWFVGYTEEPYKMILFGKTRSKMEVVTAEFLPYEKQLNIIIADADRNIHIMQFDPDHPRSLSGQRLLHKSTFHTGHFPTTMTLLPDHQISPTHTSTSTDAAHPGPQSQQQQQVLISNMSGSLALLTPLDEQAYRRLSALQTHLFSALDSACGLNPRAYRSVESEGFGSRGVIDGGLLIRGWASLGARARAEAGGKVGVESWVLRGDLEGISKVQEL